MLCTVPTIHYFEDFHCLLVEAPPFSWLDAFLDRPKELKFLLRTEAPSVREQGHPHLCLLASLLEDRSELLVTGPSEIIVKLATACSRAQCESFEGASHRIPDRSERFFFPVAVWFASQGHNHPDEGADEDLPQVVPGAEISFSENPVQLEKDKVFFWFEGF